MIDDVKFVDGRIIDIGAAKSVGSDGSMKYDFIRLETANGDVFIEKCTAFSQMSSYLSGAKQIEARIFYLEGQVPGGTETVLLGVDASDGKCYAVGPEIDLMVQKGKKGIFFMQVLLASAAIAGLALVFSIVLAVFYLPIAYGVWKGVKAVRGAKNALNRFPTSAEFARFYKNNRRSFAHA